MKTNKGSIFSTVAPVLMLFLLAAVVALACANSKSGSAPTQTSKISAAQTVNKSGGIPTPHGTQSVYSPMVGSAGTPEATPNVEISVNPLVLKGGETVTVTVTISNIEAPTYLLFVRDNGVTNVAKTIGVTDENIPIPGKSTSQVLEVKSAIGGPDRAVFVLRALLDGSTQVWVAVITGGVTTGTSTGWVSDTIQVKVGK